jgi:hypothetical protein
MPIPSDGTTFSHNIKEDANAIRTNMGHDHAGSLRTRRRQYANPVSKFASPKTFQSNKSAKIFKILVKLGLIVHKWGHQDDTKRRIRVYPLTLLLVYTVSVH